jgi:hypothetical protein
MQAATPAETLAVYKKFTSRTQYLVSKEIARDTLVGNAAAVRAPMGEGMMYLFGPHFEHPHFDEANRRVADSILWDGNRRGDGAAWQAHESDTLPTEKARRLVHVLKRELSNARIVAAGIEMAPVCWLIGAKYYEPEKIRVFLEAMWGRLPGLEKHPRPRIDAEIAEPICAWAIETTRLLREIKQRLDRKDDSLQPAQRLFSCLNRYAIAFFRIYFETLSLPT